MQRLSWMWSLAVALSLIIWSPEVNSQVSQTCENSCNDGPGWNSMLRLSETLARSVLISWTADPATTRYVVQLRERSESTFNTSMSVSDLSFRFSGLTPLTEYEIQVCRANGSTSDSDNCGNCLRCFTTVHADEPPSAPSNLQVIASGSRVLTVEWEEPQMVNGRIQSYTIICRRSDNGELVHNNTGETRTSVNNIMVIPDTNYTCTVIAINDFGSSVPAVGEVATPAESVTPGVLLVVYADQITATPLVFDNIRQSPNLLLETFSTLITISNVAGIDYHFERSELYLTTSSRQILKYDVTLTFDDDEIPQLTASTPSDLLFTRPEEVALGSIAVDWVNNDLYWIEATGGDGSRIIRSPIDGSGPGTAYCVVGWSNSPVLHVAVDPIHGYLYWNRKSIVVDPPTGLYRSSLTNTRTTSNDCPTDIPGAELIINDDSLETFTLEPDVAIYHTGVCGEPDTIVGLIFRSLNLEIRVCFDEYVPGQNQTAQTLDSFSEIVLVPEPCSASEQCRVAIYNSSDPFGFRRSSGTQVGIPLITRVYRSIKQPLPEPPSPPIDIQVQTTSTSAVISWQAPQFFGNFFSDGAFSSWNYLIRYSDVGFPAEETVNSTTSTSITLESLQPDTFYRFTISAEGPGGEREDPNNFVFSTRLEGGDEVRLLIATDAGVIEAGVDGTGVNYVDRQNSVESTGVAYDARLDRTYWAIFGGQGELYSYDRTAGSETIYDRRDNPGHLELDWVARRLFWIEDGSSVFGPLSIVSSADPFDEDPMMFAEDQVTATALDSLNGLLFWVADDTIIMKMLNGLVEQVCHVAANTPAALITDPVRMRLYWVSKLSDNCVVSVNTPYCVSVAEVDYTRSGCDSPTIRNIPDITFGSSSSAVLAYTSGILYFSPYISDTLYTVPASLSALGPELTLSVGVIPFSTLSPLPQEFRDIAVMAIEVQPLPGGVESPGLAEVTPVSPGVPSLGGSASPDNDITIEWVDSNSLTPLVYWVDYTLLRMDGSMDMGQATIEGVTSVTLTGQQAFTNVTAVVTAYTLWTGSEPSDPGNFFSHPAPPMQVQNVRVYVYFPVREGSNVTALVVWDGLSAMEAGGVVDNYIVNVCNVISGEEVTGPSMSELVQNEDARTQYSIESRNEGFSTLNTNNQLEYPLVRDTSYRVEVMAKNSAGTGDPSQSVTFSTAAASPPQQVFGVSMSGGEVIGDGTTPTLDVSPPLTVNTINRTVYWYRGDQSVLMQQSLDGGDAELVGQPPAGVTVLAVAYDWVGETVYFIARRDAAGGTLGLWRVVVVNPSGLELVFEDEGTLLSVDAEVQLAVDPFRGFVYWTLPDDSAITLQQLDLRDPTSTQTLTTTMQRRRRKRQDIATLSLTSALTLDPATGWLWVCDADTGDLLSCDPASVNCTVEVAASDLTPIAMAGDAGLPATSIALDESRIYWTRDGTPDIFFVSRTATTDLMMISGANVPTVVTLSPGQQPLPSIECLAPEPAGGVNMRPAVSLVNATNLTLTVTWTLPTLPPSCSDEVFSVAPLKSDLCVEINTNDIVPGYPQSTFDTTYVLTGLEPYMLYSIELRVENQYSVRMFNGDDGFGPPVENRTSEGVPDPPANVQPPLIYGTRNIYLRWDEPNLVPAFSTLRGDPANLQYVVRVNGTYNITIDANEVNLTAADQLQPETTHSIEVFVSNMVLVSPAVVVSATTWPLPPQPVVTNPSNTSITVEVPLTAVHEPIEEIYIEVTPVPSVSNHTTPRTVGPLPNTLTFNVQGLEPDTQYSVVAVGTYQNVSGFTDELEVTAGESIMIRTEAGVPETPVITLEQNSVILRWRRPDANGSPITLYQIIATQVGASNSSEEVVMSHFSDEEMVDFNLQVQGTDLVVGVTYDIRVVAVNAIGESEPSTTVTFTREPESESVLPQAAVIGIAVGGSAALVMLLACLILCVESLNTVGTIVCQYKIEKMWCVSSRRKKGELSLNYMYGPDHELSNLRDLHRQAHANNPHYMWSQDDYICTDEDLELLHKFPRQNLKLETFIDRGEFGEVYQGTAIDILGPDTGPTPVAVKTLRKGTTVEEQKKFLSEASLMSNFNHPNIVKVLGVCVDNDPVYIIMELMPAGDLLRFLRDAKREHGPALLTLTEQMQIVLDVSQGCRYLEQQHFIHRDIAARNCLVSSKGADRVVKIGDFGLAKDLYSSDYYQVEGQRRLPVRWMAPEALLQGKFTIESDIWSFGVLLWEIMTLGNQPYPGRTNQEVLQFVTGGGRLERPDKCPGRLYHLMQNCWKKYSSERPHFELIVTIIANFLDHLNKHESIYFDSDSDDGNDTMHRKGSTRGSARGPSRTPSIRSGIMNLARSGSMKLRNSLRRAGSLHRREEHAANHQASVSSENLIASDDADFRERGPF